MEKVIIYGGGGHAKTILEYKRHPGLIGVIDDNLPIGTKVMHTEVIANSIDDIEWDNAYNCIGGIHNMKDRRDVFRRLYSKGMVSRFDHPMAVIEPSAVITTGVHLMSGCYVGPEAMIRNNAIINTNAIVSHDCTIGSDTHICPGAILAGNVTVGYECIIGMGVTIYAGVTIGDGIKIYNGTDVFKDILEQSDVPVPGRQENR